MFEPSCQYIIQKEFTCPLCRFIFQSPVVDTCGHVFCQECILSYATKNKNCPIGVGKYYHQINIQTLKPAWRTEQYLLSQPLECVFSRNGCEWRGNLAALKIHVFDCSFSEFSIKKRAKFANSQTQFAVQEACLFKPLGCLSFLKKSEIKEHFNDTIDLHLELLLGHFKEVVNRINKLSDKLQQKIARKLHNAKLVVIFRTLSLDIEDNEIKGDKGDFIVFGRQTTDCKIVLFSPGLVRFKIGVVDFDYLEEKKFDLAKLIKNNKVTFFSTEGYAFEETNFFEFESKSLPSTKGKTIVYSEDSNENTISFTIGERVVLINKKNIDRFDPFLFFESSGSLLLLNRRLIL